jgi:hypothetical protein
MQFRESANVEFQQNVYEIYELRGQIHIRVFF